MLGMENRPIGNKLAADEYFFDADYKGVLRVDKNRKGDKPIYFINIAIGRWRPRQRLVVRERTPKRIIIMLFVYQLTEPGSSVADPDPPGSSSK